MGRVRPQPHPDPFGEWEAPDDSLEPPVLIPGWVEDLDYGDAEPLGVLHLPDGTTHEVWPDDDEEPFPFGFVGGTS